MKFARNGVTLVPIISSLLIQKQFMLEQLTSCIPL